MYLYMHRKDLRTGDLRAFEAIKRRGGAGIHVLVIDPALAGGGRLKTHSGRTFLRSAARLEAAYAAAGQTLHVLYGDPAEAAEAMMAAHPVAGIVVQADYTPYARRRDARLQAAAERLGRGFKAYDDAPLVDLADFQHFARRAEPYKVFTPFYRMWDAYMRQCCAPAGRVTVRDLTTVADIGPALAARFAPPPDIAAALAEAAAGELRDPAGPAYAIARFAAERLPLYAEDAGSGIARWLNSGALSAREAYEAVQDGSGAAAWVRQLAWRDFYLYQARYHEDYFAYENKYDLSVLRDTHFEAWAGAKTGIPIIDAAMTQLRETGEMPNRLRMVTAMFLTKNLLCPFTQGERYFRDMLADYDNTLNRGGWLWSSSLGYDAAPYFRIMNPVTQSRTHDPAGAYIRKWLPHLAHLSNQAIHEPQPGAIVDLKASRARAIEVYKELLGG